MDSNSCSEIVQKKQQSNCSHVRNICVLAHVDHGKTTLVDCLLASNHIISQRMAGKLRYMDSRPDEQQRGITMKSSSISLVYKYMPSDAKNHLINVIDSPGHVDFFGEVSTALRICDGCIIIVDVIEGVCAQTRAALQQAWLARVRPILVLNKIDRLFVEKKLSSLDIHIQLTQTLEQVNAFVGELFASEVLAKMNANFDEQQKSSDQSATMTATTEKQISKKKIFYDWSSGLDDIDDSGVYFSPENGNVLFASAIDGWGFTIADFARILSSKLGFSVNALTKTLWGDYYLNAREKRIQKGAQSKAKKPLFVTFVLENLSKIYEKFLIEHDKLEMIKMAQSLGVTLETRDVDRSDHRQALMLLFNQWIPLSCSLLRIVCDIVPAPCDINEERVERFITANQTRRFDSLPLQTQMLKQAFLECRPQQSSEDCVPLIAYVTKMFSYPKESLPQFRIKPLTHEEIIKRREEMKMKREQEKSEHKEEQNQIENIDEEKEKITFIGFARIFSGTLRRNDFVYVLGPKHDPSLITDEMIEEIDRCELTLSNLRFDQHVTKVQIKELYLLMGRDLESVDEVHAGHICGIGNLQSHVIKSATLSSTIYCPSFTDDISKSIPILRVAVEPKNPWDLSKLTQALRMLNQSDPCVDVKIQETGEHVIITTGEVHLERCIVDLVNFLGEDIEFNISDPIVPFRETIIEPPKVDTLNEALSDQKTLITSVTLSSSSSSSAAATTTTTTNVSKKSSKIIEQMTPNKKFLFRVRAKPLPETVVETLEKSRDILIQMMQFQRKNVLTNTNTSYMDSNEIFTTDLCEAMNELRKKLEQQFNDAGGWPTDTIDRIWSLGPKFYGSNLLINCLKDFNHKQCFPSKSLQQQQQQREESSNDNRYTYEDSFINGFQLCTQSGPLCDEPMMGVCFIVEEWKSLESFDDNDNDNETTMIDPFGPISGQIMSTVKEICRRAFQSQPQRLMAAMFSCIIQIDSDALGKMYAVIGRRNGRILHADVQEGSQIFTVNAILPVIESFNFVNEIRKQTSGKAIPQLTFSHWEVIDIDPFWTPTTEEEYKLYGEKADTENRSLRYMNAVRRRKGLHVEEKIVEHAEKQRTLTKNK